MPKCHDLADYIIIFGAGTIRANIKKIYNKL
jgi:hypothetical protein